MESARDKQLKKFLIPILRRKSLYWPARNEAIKLSRRERGFYECASCKNLFGRKEINADHVRPVINVKTSWVSWDHFIDSLLCDVSNFQILCISCHSIKSALETEIRKINKKRKIKA